MIKPFLIGMHLNDSQARSENKLHFQFNASLTSINIAKAIHWLSIPKNERGAFSMADIKTMNHNILMLNRFFDVFGICPHSAKNKIAYLEKTVKDLIHHSVTEILLFRVIAQIGERQHSN